MSETISRPFTFVKDGIFYFSRRIPNDLKSHYTSPRIAFSLRTRSAKVAEARARKAADQLDDYWYHLRCQNVKLPGKHMLREQGLTSGEGAAQGVLSGPLTSVHLNYRSENLHIDYNLLQ